MKNSFLKSLLYMKSSLRLGSMLLLIALALFLSPGLNGQGAGSALEVTRRMADKVIRETSFSYQLVPLEYNAGITRFLLRGSTQGESGDLWYAFAKLNSGEERDGWLGFSFSGQVKLLLNGEEVFAGESERVFLKEFTYDRYQFQRVIMVHWEKGINQLLVKWCAGHREKGVPGEFLMLPLGETDAGDAGIHALPVAGSMPLSCWITSGPWRTGSEDAMDRLLPPEKKFSDYYIFNGRIMAWEAEQVPLVRELVIPGNNSYSRDPYADWHYANGGTMLGILSLYETSGDTAYLEFVERFAGNILENDDWFRWQYFNLHAVRGILHRLNRMTMLDDSGGPVLPFAELQLLDPGADRYMELLQRNFDYVMKGQERLEDGTFCRLEPEPATVWADDLFMSVPFLLRMARINNDPSLYDEVARQVILFNHYLSDASTGLFFHGWYNQRGENTPVRWGRANGWMVWATSEALMQLPENHPDYKKILKIYRNHMKALAAVQAESGMWHQVLDHPETFEESSCTAMFTLGMARGVRLGWLPKSYGPKALKAWDALQGRIREDGTVTDICRGTGIGDDVAFYEARQRFDHDPRGLGAMITAGCEIYLLENR